MNKFLEMYAAANKRVNHLLIMDDKAGKGRFCVDFYRTNTNNNTTVFSWSTREDIVSDCDYLEAISNTLQSSYTNTVVREMEIEFETIYHTDSAKGNGLRVRVWIDLWDSVTLSNTFISYRSKVF